MEPEYYRPKERVNWLELPDQFAHQMAQLERYRWYKPLLVMLLAGLIWLISIVALVLILIPFSDSFTWASDGDDPANILSYGMDLLITFLFIPAFALAMKITGLGGIGTFSSIEKKLRWDRIRSFLPWTLLVMGLATAIDVGLSLATGDLDPATIRILPVSVVALLILAPLQSAAEEYVFRGFALQTFSAWLPTILLPVLLQALIFGSLHSQYNLLGIADVTLMGFLCGYIACKTGGIEGSICIHATNNTVAMIESCFIAAAAPTYDVTVLGCIVGCTIDICFALVILWVSKRKGYLLKKCAKSNSEPFEVSN